MSLRFRPRFRGAPAAQAGGLSSQAMDHATDPAAATPTAPRSTSSGCTAPGIRKWCSASASPTSNCWPPCSPLHAAHPERAVLATRVAPSAQRLIAERRPASADSDLRIDPLGATVLLGPVPELSGEVALVSAGTSDGPVVAEAAATLCAFGVGVDVIADVGVAGVHRVLAAQDRLRSADAVIVVAGMDGALPSVVGGLTGRPVVAVPTSVGYGASFGGVAALLTMLNSCAPGVAVVNIDNGFGAAVHAARIVR